MKLFEITYKGGDSIMTIKMFIAKDMVGLMKYLELQRWVNTITNIKEIEVIVCD